MEWDIIAAIATVISATAVVASVIYGAHQLKINTRALNANSHHQWVAEQREVNRLFVENPEMCELLLKGDKDFESLTDAERLRLAFLFWAAFNLWNFVRRARKQGVVDQAIHDENSLGFEWFIKNHETVRKTWQICRIGYGHEFCEYIDTIVFAAEAAESQKTCEAAPASSA